jgi:hypothetical protein
MAATKGLPLKKKLLSWVAFVLSAAVPTYVLLQVWPDGTNTVTIYSSSDKEGSRVGPISAFVFSASVFAVFWLGRQLGKMLKTKIFGDNLT